MAEGRGGSRFERLDRQAGRAYGCFLTAVLLILGLLCFRVAFIIWRSPGGTERWVGLALTMLAGLALLALAGRTAARRRMSEWLDQM